MHINGCLTAKLAYVIHLEVETNVLLKYFY
jgi:hypothetical protein